MSFVRRKWPLWKQHRLRKIVDPVSCPALATFPSSPVFEVSLSELTESSLAYGIVSHLIILGFLPHSSFLLGYDLRNDIQRDDLESSLVVPADLSFSLAFLEISPYHDIAGVHYSVPILGIRSLRDDEMPLSITRLVHSVSNLRVRVTGIGEGRCVLVGAFSDSSTEDERKHVLSVFPHPELSTGRCLNSHGFVLEYESSKSLSRLPRLSLPSRCLLHLFPHLYCVALPCSSGLEILWWCDDELGPEVEEYCGQEVGSPWWNSELDAVTVTSVVMNESFGDTETKTVSVVRSGVVLVESILRDLQPRAVLVNFDYQTLFVHSISGSICCVGVGEYRTNRMNCFRISVRFVLLLYEMRIEVGETKIFGGGCLQVHLQSFLEMVYLKTMQEIGVQLPRSHVDEEEGCVLTNEALFEGRSLDLLCHPSLPLVVTGPQTQPRTQ